MKIGPNHPCDCGSGKKFKKCCGARGRITDPVQAEQQAHSEEYWREQRKKPKKSGVNDAAALFPLLYGMAAQSYPGPGPAPPKPKRRNRRKP